MGKKLEYLTWFEAEEELKKTDFITIPLGARLKEHGPHLPLNNDWIIAEKMTDWVLEEFNTLALPTVQHGFYPAFVNYPGSVHITMENSKALIGDIINSFTKFGNKKFFILNTGVSTCWALEPLRLELAEEGVHMEYFDWFAVDGLDDITEQPEGTHADEFETSMMMVFAPEIVREDKLVKDIHPKVGRGPFLRENNGEPGRYSPTGVYGDATLASVEKGEKLLKLVRGHVVQQIKEFQSRKEMLSPNQIYLK